jgi:nucleotide-binding universal stress UspA family protein
MNSSATTPYRKILAAIDGTDHRHRLLAAAGDLAAMTGSSIDVLHVDADSSAFDTASDTETEHNAVDLVADAVAGLRSRGVVANGLIAHAADSDVDDTIIKAARDHESDLVVLGPNHRRGLAGWFEASITDRVTHHTSVPILLIP